MKSQSFGSVWTTTKLDIVDSYLSFYVTALKKQRFKLCYIDAFAGSGRVKIKEGDEIDGSAIRALKYAFNRFYFFEKDAIYYELLQQRVEQEFWNLTSKVTLRNEDCNELLMKINDFDWIRNKWQRLNTIFPTVSEKAILLRNEKNSPIFLLCFAGSNPSLKAKELSLRAADHILTKL